MIPITKEEKELLSSLYPGYRYPRTMKNDSKRHHYYCTEDERLMRAIANSNDRAAAVVREIDRQQKLYKAQSKYQRMSYGNY